MRANIQRFGAKLAGMVMPNIGAFIAWGLITALFIPDGWIPNKDLAELVGPMITFLLPLLIGFTGGKLVHGHRGGVVGAVATMGVIVGAAILSPDYALAPMFLGAMIMGPLGGWIIKQFDEAIEGKVKPGFEMLIDNFSAGIVGGALAVVGPQGCRTRSSSSSPTGSATASTSSSTTTSFRLPRSSSSPPRCCSSTTRSTTAC